MGMNQRDKAHAIEALNWVLVSMGKRLPGKYRAALKYVLALLEDSPARHKHLTPTVCYCRTVTWDS